MQTLNLSGESKKSDGRLKSLFWPTVENAWDVDYLGQQGFWICLIVSILSMAFIAITASFMLNPAVRTVTLVSGGIACFVYFVGGMGVRQSSWPAALTIFVLYILDQIASRRVGIVSIIISAVLLSNVRATFLSAKWKPAAEDEDKPTRFNETFRDKLVDQLPPRAWPILKYPFYVCAALVLIMVIAGLMLRPPHRVPNQFPNDNDIPSATVSVAPPQ